MPEGEGDAPRLRPADQGEEGGELLLQEGGVGAVGGGEVGADPLQADPLDAGEALDQGEA